MKLTQLIYKVKSIEKDTLSLYDDVTDDLYGLEFIDAIIRINNAVVDFRELLTDLDEKQEGV